MGSTGPYGVCDCFVWESNLNFKCEIQADIIKPFYWLIGQTKSIYWWNWIILVALHHLIHGECVQCIWWMCGYGILHVGGVAFSVIFRCYAVLLCALCMAICSYIDIDPVIMNTFRQSTYVHVSHEHITANISDMLLGRSRNQHVNCRLWRVSAHSRVVCPHVNNVIFVYTYSGYTCACCSWRFVTFL